MRKIHYINGASSHQQTPAIESGQLIPRSGSLLTLARTSCPGRKRPWMFLTLPASSNSLMWASPDCRKVKGADRLKSMFLMAKAEQQSTMGAEVKGATARSTRSQDVDRPVKPLQQCHLWCTLTTLLPASSTNTPNFSTRFTRPGTTSPSLNSDSTRRPALARLLLADL